MDIKATKDFQIGLGKYIVFLKIINLFDTLNEDDVYADTGRAGYTLTRSSGAVSGPLSYDDYYKRSDFYSAPRQLKIGVSLGF